MVGILIIAHGTLGESLISCASHVMGSRPPYLAHLAITPQDDPCEVLPQATARVESLDQGDGVLVLSDLFGATPSNIACKLLSPGRVEGVAGASLPMLVRALTYRNEPLSKVVEKAVSGGSEGIVRLPSSQVEHAPAGD